MLHHRSAGYEHDSSPGKFWQRVEIGLDPIPQIRDGSDSVGHEFQVVEVLEAGYIEPGQKEQLIRRERPGRFTLTGSSCPGPLNRVDRPPALIRRQWSHAPILIVARKPDGHDGQGQDRFFPRVKVIDGLLKDGSVVHSGTQDDLSVNPDPPFRESVQVLPDLGGARILQHRQPRCWVRGVN